MMRNDRIFIFCETFKKGKTPLIFSACLQNGINYVNHHPIFTLPVSQCVIKRVFVRFFRGHQCQGHNGSFFLPDSPSSNSQMSTFFLSLYKRSLSLGTHTYTCTHRCSTPTTSFAILQRSTEKEDYSFSFRNTHTHLIHFIGNTVGGFQRQHHHLDPNI